MPLFLYRFLIILCTPFIWLHIARRTHAGKEDPTRVSERYGIPSPPLPLQKEEKIRPLWIHAASVGEATTALTIATLAHDIDPTLPILITTGTVTSADLIAKRLPHNTIHQYAPYDHPLWVNRFLDRWAPRATIRIESELWPNMCRALTQRHIPTMLLNAHLSNRSFQRWRLFPRTTRQILAAFTHIFADGIDNAARYISLGAKYVTPLPSLKFIAPTLPVHIPTQIDFITAIKNRPVWIYASTHADEEILAARVHADLKQKFPNVLTLIALRHPNRAASVMKFLSVLPFKTEQRSTAHVPRPDTDLYIIDTIGELGVFFASVPVAMIGRSFSIDGGGGHNPIEPALFGCLPLSGPAIQNLTTIYSPMLAAGVVDIVQTPNALSAHIADLLENPIPTKARGESARAFILAQQDTLKSTLRQAITDILKSCITSG